MTYLWIGMMLGALVCFLLNNPDGSLTASCLAGAKSAMELGVTLGGSLCLWGGISRVMEIGGISGWMANRLKPLFQKIFPMASGDETALSFLCANFSANFLGLGNAATPLGISATRRMGQLSGKNVASDEMCRLVVMNTASVQLIPTTVAALRAGQGSQNPLDILPAVWLTSICSVSAGLVAAYFLGKCWEKHG